jgi:hypothetical protein
MNRPPKIANSRHGLATKGLKIDKIDKTFLIAKPMRKVDWTKRVAAGWGERGAGKAFCELAESG